MSDQSQQPTGYSTYKRLLGYAKPYRPYFLLALLGMEIYAIAEAKIAALIQVIIDEVFIAQDVATVKSVLAILITLGVARGLGTLMSDYFMTVVGRGLIKNMRAKMFDRLLHLPVAIYDKSSAGEMLSVFTYNAEQVVESVTSVITSCIRDAAVIIGLIIVMLSMNPTLTLVFFVTIPVAASVVYLVSSRFRKISRRIQNSVGDVAHVVNESVEGHQVVKLYDGFEKEQSSFEIANLQNFRQHLKFVLVKSGSGFLIQMTGVLVLASIIYLSTSGYLGNVTAGVFSAFVMAMVRMFPALKHLTDVSAKLQKGIAAAETMFELIDMPVEKNSGQLSLQQLRGDIEFKDVSFSYTEGAELALSNIDFNIKSGQTVALVGRSGSGKSTIAKLLARFYTASAGKILLDGNNLEDYVLEDLRQQIAFVGQHVTLFNDTIANNIAYGSLAKASREEIIAAARMAHAMEFIDKLPDGLDTIVGENGLMLSGGQRQRLAIARALLKNAPILILDEATSALDTESERYIQKALEALMKDRTTLVIAHRLSTVENADQIVVLDGGQIVESGSHESLLAKDEHYASLYKLQFNLGGNNEEREQPTVQQQLVEYVHSGQDFLKDKPESTVWEQLWYGYHPLAQLLAPIGYLFNVLVTLRRWLYRIGVLKQTRFPAPVIVVGNVTVGGTGKTPLVIWLANHLQKLGYKPGIISRGYKGKSKVWPIAVTEELDTEKAGDEAMMILQRTQCPMVVGPDRRADINKLLTDYHCDIVISDDGLQHYALDRDIEIVVADGARGFGNGMMLPAGPMREPKSRLREADYIITNGARLPNSVPMRVDGKELFCFDVNQAPQPLELWKGKSVHAVAAIGNPERFYELLRQQGLNVIEHRFEDHYDFKMNDITFADDLPVLMTEKDAVKCKQFASSLVLGRYWYLPVTADLPEEFVQQLDQHIKSLFHERKAA